LDDVLGQGEFVEPLRCLCLAADLQLVEKPQHHTPKTNPGGLKRTQAVTVYTCRQCMVVLFKAIKHSRAVRGARTCDHKTQFSTFLKWPE
jgi:hypothetical protein